MCIVCTYYAYNLFMATFFFPFFGNSWLNSLGYLASNRPVYNSGPADLSRPDKHLADAIMAVQGRSQHKADHSTD